MQSISQFRRPHQKLVSYVCIHYCKNIIICLNEGIDLEMSAQYVFMVFKVDFNLFTKIGVLFEELSEAQDFISCQNN